jgi:hypothetical protein
MLLPPEILCEIALHSPGAYFGLVQCTKLIKIDMDLAMRHFTRKSRKVVGVFTEGECWFTEYKLPNGNLHSIYDIPSSVSSYGASIWHYNGVPHRGNDMPAYTAPPHESRWYRYGILHRYNGPAVITSEGVSEHWIQGIPQI